jgi:hypothetical protein
MKKTVFLLIIELSVALFEMVSRQAQSIQTHHETTNPNDTIIYNQPTMPIDNRVNDQICRLTLQMKEGFSDVI